MQTLFLQQKTTIMEAVMKYNHHIDPRKDIPYDMSDDCILSKDGVNPVTYDPEREWGKNKVNYDGFHLDFPGAVPPAYFPGYPGWPYD